MNNNTEIKFGDWMCPVCNVNIFRSKNECRKCKTKKPILIVNKPNEIYGKITKELYTKLNEENIKQREEKIQQAEREGLPKLFYVTSCTLCKNQHNPQPHNCWKYS